MRELGSEGVSVRKLWLKERTFSLMIEYVILGTSHDNVQDSPKFERLVREAIRKHAIKLVAEEHPLDTTSRVQAMTNHLHIPYLQIDLFPEN
jgi:hypothetical protein